MLSALNRFPWGFVFGFATIGSFHAHKWLRLKEANRVPIVAGVFQQPLDSQDNDGMTLLHYAAINEDIESVFELLNMKANTNIKNNDGEYAKDITKDENIIELITEYENSGILNLPK